MTDNINTNRMMCSINVGVLKLIYFQWNIEQLNIEFHIFLLYWDRRRAMVILIIYYIT